MTSEPPITARRVVAIIERTRIQVSTEAKAHAAIAFALRAHGLEVETEVWIDDHNRVDLLVAGAVVVEVKTKGSRSDIHAQLRRYAKLDRVRALVIATAGAWPSGAFKVEDKPLLHASLSRGWL